MSLARLARVNGAEDVTGRLPTQEERAEPRHWAAALDTITSILRRFFLNTLECGATMCSSNACVSRGGRALPYILLRVPTPTGQGRGEVVEYAHRLVFSHLAEEKLIVGNMVLHRCHKGTCLKLGCLYQGTAKDNAEDRANLTKQGTRGQLRREEIRRLRRQANARGGRAQSRCTGCGQFTTGGAPHCVACAPPPLDDEGAPP